MVHTVQLCTGGSDDTCHLSVVCGVASVGMNKRVCRLGKGVESDIKCGVVCEKELKIL